MAHWQARTIDHGDWVDLPPDRQEVIADSPDEKEAVLDALQKSLPLGELLKLLPKVARERHDEWQDWHVVHDDEHATFSARRAGGYVYVKGEPK